MALYSFLFGREWKLFERYENFIQSQFQLLVTEELLLCVHLLPHLNKMSN